jgi:hypothetical protein
LREPSYQNVTNHRPWHGTECGAQSDLAPSLCDEKRRDAVRSDCGEQQSHSGEHAHEQEHEALPYERRTEARFAVLDRDNRLFGISPSKRWRSPS